MNNNLKKCPECGHTNFEEDYRRAETYCKHCGLVLSMPYSRVAGVKVENNLSYDYSKQRRPTNKSKIGSSCRPDYSRYNIPAHLIQKYTHNIPNHLLMKHF